MKRRDDKTAAIYRGVMRHVVGADRVATRRQAKAELSGKIGKLPAEAAKPAPAAETAQAAAPAPRGRKPLKITDDVLAAARRQRPPVHVKRAGDPSPFKPYVPPPGVLPKGVEPIAMDEAFGETSFGAVSNWGWDGLGSSGFSEGLGFLGFAYLAELTQRPEYRRMSERIATEMTREWIELNATSGPVKPKRRSDPVAEPGDEPETPAQTTAQNDKTEKIRQLDDELQRLKIKDAFYNAAEQDGWFGRSHVYLDMAPPSDAEDATSIGNGRNAASKAKVRRASPLVAVRNIEPMWCYPALYEARDPRKAEFYRPTAWYMNGITVHASRLLTFVGRQVPDMLKPAYAFGGLALSQMAKPYVDNWLRTRQAVADLIESFSVSGVYTNMAGALEDGGVEALRRIDLFNTMRSNAGSFALDKETEEFFNVSTPLGTLDDLQAQSQEQLSSVSGIPLVILLGITPKGLNASSEGEIRAFYDWIHAYQESLFRDNLQAVIDFVQLSLWGKVDPDIGFSFKPLWSMTEKEEAEVDKLEAEADQIRIDSGVLDPSEARSALAAKPGSRYSDIDPDDVPEPPEPVDAGDGEDDGAVAGEHSDKPEADAAFDAVAPFRRARTGTGR